VRAPRCVHEGRPSPGAGNLSARVSVPQKKTITDVLASSEPRAGAPADLQALVTQHFSDKLSVIEQEELMLPGEFRRVLLPLERSSGSAPVLILCGRRPQTPASCPVTT